MSSCARQTSVPCIASTVPLCRKVMKLPYFMSRPVNGSQKKRKRVADSRLFAKICHTPWRVSAADFSNTGLETGRRQVFLTR